MKKRQSWKSSSGKISGASSKTSVTLSLTAFTRRCSRKKRNAARDVTDKIDKIALHPIMGFVIFLVVIFLLFKISFDFSTPFMDWTQGLINNFFSPLMLSLLSNIGAGKWLPEFFPKRSSEESAL